MSAPRFSPAGHGGALGGLLAAHGNPARVVIRVDGSIESIARTPRTSDLAISIGADTLDTVMLADRRHVMLVDDTGLVDGKPINERATALYHQVCVRGTVHPICGDVAIVPDGDFA